MNHTDYIGKPLKCLVQATPKYAINYYELIYEGKVKFLKDVVDDNKWMEAKISYISELYPDYHYDIKLE